MQCNFRAAYVFLNYFDIFFGYLFNPYAFELYLPLDCAINLIHSTADIPRLL
jgi:hypothetical protein